MACLDWLPHVEAFQALTKTELAVIDGFCREKEFSHGDRIFKEGDDATHLYVVIEGLVDLRFDLPARETSEAQTLSSVQENSIFGWSSMVPPFRYRLSAYCASERCRVMMIERSRFQDYLRQYPETGYRVLAELLKVVGSRFQQLQGSSGESPLALAKVTVHMVTCGIAAGARDVMKALTEEMSRSGRQNVTVETGGCLGKCWSEPNVTVQIHNQGPVVYQKMDAEKMRRVFNEHIISGKVQKDCVLEEGGK
ncbi:MAG: cyclic nucleotide-binding domain-containing protein [Desulfobacterales bacterium]|nr:cyclic nucleotide-binding domain-containing protein [Desulfobacterales bacterium]